VLSKRYRLPPGFRGEVDIREEIDVVSVDPLFIERQRNRYASRGLAYIVLLNGLAAIALLISLAHWTSSTESTKRFADAMMVFGIGAAAGLASALFAYLRRTVSIQLPRQVAERRFLGWFAVAAAIIGAGCFVGALNMGRMAVTIILSFLHISMCGLRGGQNHAPSATAR
jgi:hypothetical protein